MRKKLLSVGCLVCLFLRGRARRRRRHDGRRCGEGSRRCRVAKPDREASQRERRGGRRHDGAPLGRVLERRGSGRHVDQGRRGRQRVDAPRRHAVVSRGAARQRRDDGEVPGRRRGRQQAIPLQRRNAADGCGALRQHRHGQAAARRRSGRQCEGDAARYDGAELGSRGESRRRGVAAADSRCRPEGGVEGHDRWPRRR